MFSRIPNSYHTNFAPTHTKVEPVRRERLYGEPPYRMLAPAVGLNERHMVTTQEPGIRMASWEGRNTVNIGMVNEDVEGTTLSGRHTFSDSLLDQVPEILRRNPGLILYLGIPPNNPQKYVPLARPVQLEAGADTVPTAVSGSSISLPQRPEVSIHRSRGHQSEASARQLLNSQRKGGTVNYKDQACYIPRIRTASSSSDSSNSVASPEPAHSGFHVLQTKPVRGSRMQLWPSPSNSSAEEPSTSQTASPGAEIREIFSRRRTAMMGHTPPMMPTRLAVERSVSHPAAVLIPGTVSESDAVSITPSSSVSSTSSSNTDYWRLAQASYNKRMFGQAPGNHRPEVGVIPQSDRSGTSSPVILGADVNGPYYIPSDIGDSLSQGISTTASLAREEQAVSGQASLDVRSSTALGAIRPDGEPGSLIGSPGWRRVDGRATVTEAPPLRAPRNAPLSALLQVYGSPGIVRVRNTGTTLMTMTTENSRTVAYVTLTRRLNRTLPGLTLQQKQQRFVGALNAAWQACRVVQVARSAQGSYVRTFRQHIRNSEITMCERLRDFLEICAHGDVLNFGLEDHPTTDAQLDTFANSERFRIFVEAINAVYNQWQNGRPRDDTDTQFDQSPASTAYVRTHPDLLDAPFER